MRDRELLTIDEPAAARGGARAGGGALGTVGVGRDGRVPAELHRLRADVRARRGRVRLLRTARRRSGRARVAAGVSARRLRRRPRGTAAIPAGGAARARRASSDLLPIADPALLPPLPVGPSPLLAVPRLRERAVRAPALRQGRHGAAHRVAQGPRLVRWSSPRRASSAVRVVTTASTGNAATALAAMARGGRDRVRASSCRPDAPRAKLAQIARSSARACCGSTGPTTTPSPSCLEAACSSAGTTARPAYNPYTIEGKKTVALRDLGAVRLARSRRGVRADGRRRHPRGRAQGLRRSVAAGARDRCRGSSRCRRRGSAAIVGAWRSGADAVTPLARAQTIADSIRVALPGLRELGLAGVARDDGAGVRVSDAAILSAMRSCGRAGVFAEPAAAASLAGLLRAQCEALIDAMRGSWCW